MGIGGHMLGPRKLRRLKTRTGLDVARAYRRGRYTEGVVWSGDQHTHYAIDWESGEAEPLDTPWHWWSCQFPGSVIPERTGEGVLMRALIRLVRDLPASLRALARQRGRDLRATVDQSRAADLRVMAELGPDAVDRWMVERQRTARWQYEEVMLRWADLLDPERTDGS